jgi:hypothetical protein
MPPLRQPMQDERTTLVTRPWAMFFQDLAGVADLVSASSAGYYEPLATGGPAPTEPELIFASGDVIMVWVEP